MSASMFWKVVLITFYSLPFSLPWAVVSGLVVGTSLVSANNAEEVGSVTEKSGKTKVQVWCETSKGQLKIDVHPEWTPLGAARFLELVDHHPIFFQENALYRAVKDFVVQFGVLKGFTKELAYLQDDPATELNLPHGVFPKGGISFAGTGIASRDHHFFFSMTNSTHLGKAPFERPFAIVTSDTMHVLDAFYNGYGELRVFGGKAPDPFELETQGNEWLKKEYPLIDFLQGCSRHEDETVVEDRARAAALEAAAFAALDKIKPQVETIPFSQADETIKQGKQTFPAPDFTTPGAFFWVVVFVCVGGLFYLLRGKALASGGKRV